MNLLPFRARRLLKQRGDRIDHVHGLVGLGQEHVATHFHRALAEAGYIIISIDNRGTPAPRGTELQLRVAVSHLNEVWAVETAGAMLAELAGELGWEFVLDAARWTYDEARHMLMGQRRESMALSEAEKEVIAYHGARKQVWNNTDLEGPWLNGMRNSVNAQIFSFGHKDFLAVSATHGTAHLALLDQTMWDK